MSIGDFIANRSVRVALLAAALLPFGYAWATRATEDTTKVLRSHPALFARPYACSAGSNADVHARRFERYARLYMERYPYDPADGVRAVAHFRKAASCYASAGHKSDAVRATTRARNLSSQIETDYASARVALQKTLASRNWSSALPEAHRLLRLTQHLRPDPYVTWLEKTVRKVAARGDQNP